MSKKTIRGGGAGRFGPIAAVRARPGRPTKGLLSLGGAAFPCALGRGGISAFKKEGDGATPLAAMAVLSCLVRRGAQAMPRTALAVRAIAPSLGWCDAPADRNYNRPVSLPYTAGHERMWRADHLYDVCIVLGWNVVPRRRNGGSAIFLHLAKPGYAPTEGCIAVSRRTMARLLPLLRRGFLIRVTR